MIFLMKPFKAYLIGLAEIALIWELAVCGMDNKQPKHSEAWNPNGQ